MKHILIVDDNTALREAFNIAAKDEDVQIHFCESGEDALAFLASGGERMDVALIDLAMYPMDGTSLTELIRSNEKVRQENEMPIAFYTAQVIDEVVEDVQKENHIAMVFAKPTDPITLIRKIKEWLH